MNERGHSRRDGCNFMSPNYQEESLALLEAVQTNVRLIEKL